MQFHGFYVLWCNTISGQLESTKPPESEKILRIGEDGLDKGG